MTDLPTLDYGTFQMFADLVYERAGIKLGEKKEALVQARIGKRMRQLGVSDFRKYFKMVESDESGEEVTLMLDAIATNVTHFFRESRHFDLLKELLQKWSAQGQTRFRIWSAASSTGEEPYSIAMTVREALGDVKDLRILATDISTKALAEAKAGIYEKRDVENIPKPLLNKYFRAMHDPEGRYEVTPGLRALVTFARLNLAHPPYPMKGPFDVIFCRNVMIYFDNPVRKRLLDNCHDLLKPGGYLLVGHAESLSGMLSNFKTAAPSVYTKV